MTTAPTTLRLALAALLGLSGARALAEDVHVHVTPPESRYHMGQDQMPKAPPSTAAVFAAKAKKDPAKHKVLKPVPPKAAPARPAFDAAAYHASATKACQKRADHLFVRKCIQACMIDSKNSTRVLASAKDRDLCQSRCGHQPELQSFLSQCVTRADSLVAARLGGAKPAPAKAAPAPAKPAAPKAAPKATGASAAPKSGSMAAP